MQKCSVKLLATFLLTIFSVFQTHIVEAQTLLPQQAIAQIQRVIEEKAARTLVQQKIDSQLLYEIKRRRGDEASGPEFPSLRSGVEVNGQGKALVEIQAGVTPELLKEVENLGGEVVYSSERFHSVTAYIPLDKMESLASLPNVQFIRPWFPPVLNKINTTEGDVAHLASLARNAFGVDGTGVSVGVISDSVDELANLQTTGDLPAVTVLSGQSGIPGSSEGTAMLEIVHDVAPGAELFFATALPSQAAFATNILALRDAGSDIIVDDVAYFAESPFQDDIISQAVNEVTLDGVLYFSSAGNSGNKNDGTSGVWEGNFVDGGDAAPLMVMGRLHSFGGTAANPITLDSPSLFTLKWSDPLGASSNDYDLFLFDSTLTTLFAQSTNPQTGTQDPIELISSQPFNDTGNILVVVKFSGQPRFLRLNTHRGRLATNTAGQTFGHSAAPLAFGVAAVNVATASGSEFIGGAANPVESFSSDGPRRVFYRANGTAITPGNFLASGGTVRQAPNIAAADGVSTATPGFDPFFGTSAAAPHAAAIAALMLDGADTTLSTAQVQAIFDATGLDIEAPGIDRDSGSGIIDAFAAVESALSSPPPRLINLSTRARVETGDKVMIGGFVIGGNKPKTVLIRARGPSLANAGVPGVLANPNLSLFSGQTMIATNDDWQRAQEVEIQATGKAPLNPLEAAILVTLDPGPYTAIVKGLNDATGVGIIEVFEVDGGLVPPRLINISTRAQVGTSDNVMISGFIIGGASPRTVLMRARGPSLANAGVPGVLANPVLRLFSGQTVLAANDDWQTSPDANLIEATGKAPPNSLEAAILITLDPGPYTAIVSGLNGGTGIAIGEVFEIDN